MRIGERVGRVFFGDRYYDEPDLRLRAIYRQSWWEGFFWIPRTVALPLALTFIIVCVALWILWHP